MTFDGVSVVPRWPEYLKTVEVRGGVSGFAVLSLDDHGRFEFWVPAVRAMAAANGERAGGAALDGAVADEYRRMRSREAPGSA